MTKQEIINDETLFQRACEKFVERNVIYCVSSLMYDIGQNLEASAKIFDFDYDEAIGWFQRDDWEEPVAWFIRNDATKDELEAIAGMEIEDDSDATREGVLETVEDFEEVGREYNLDPYVTEALEFWLVNSHFHEQLEAAGEIVFEFENMLVWSRMTSGQAISLDSTIRRMTRELPDDHWIFWDEK